MLHVPIRTIGRSISYVLLITVFMIAAITPMVHASDCSPDMAPEDCNAILNNWPNWILESDSCAATDDGSADLTGNGHVEQAYNFFVSKPGMTPQAAAGMVGNFQAESGPNLDPTIENGIGAYGIAQWTNPPYSNRLPALKDYAQAHGKPVSDFGIQLSFSWHELTGGYKSSVLIPIEKASTAKEAAYIVYAKYEVPGDGSNPTREANATKIYNQFAGNGASTDSSTPTDISGSSSSASVGCDESSVPTPTGSCDLHGPAYENVVYKADALKKMFGNAGNAQSHPDLHLTSVSFMGKTVQVNAKVAPCLSAVAQKISSLNLSYKVRAMGCYRYDTFHGAAWSLNSYHSYGAACDINPDTNAYNGSTHDMPQEYVKVFHDYGFYWGGNWHSAKDWMHFEFHGIKP